MTERDTFVRAILDAPADDTARLVFADWLDERGGRPWDRAHAELIRLQLARHLDPAAGDPQRETALIKKWAGRLLPRTGRDDLSFRPCEVGGATIGFPGSLVATRYAFARGFLSAVEIVSGSGTPRGPETGAFLREALANRPLESARVVVAGYAPVLTLAFRPLPSATRRDWSAELTSAYGDDREDPVTELICYSRAALLAALPDWFDEELCEVEFEQEDEPIPF